MAPPNQLFNADPQQARALRQALFSPHNRATISDRLARSMWADTVLKIN